MKTKTLEVCDEDMHMKGRTVEAQNEITLI